MSHWRGSKRPSDCSVQPSDCSVQPSDCSVQLRHAPRGSSPSWQSCTPTSSFGVSSSHARWQDSCAERAIFALPWFLEGHFEASSPGSGVVDGRSYTGQECQARCAGGGDPCDGAGRTRGGRRLPLWGPAPRPHRRRTRGARRQRDGAVGCRTDAVRTAGARGPRAHPRRHGRGLGRCQTRGARRALRAVPAGRAALPGSPPGRRGASGRSRRSNGRGHCQGIGLQRRQRASGTYAAREPAPCSRRRHDRGRTRAAAHTPSRRHPGAVDARADRVGCRRRRRGPRQRAHRLQNGRRAGTGAQGGRQRGGVLPAAQRRLGERPRGGRGGRRHAGGLARARRGSRRVRQQRTAAAVPDDDAPLRPPPARRRPAPGTAPRAVLLRLSPRRWRGRDRPAAQRTRRASRHLSSGGAAHAAGGDERSQRRARLPPGGPRCRARGCDGEGSGVGLRRGQPRQGMAQGQAGTHARPRRAGRGVGARRAPRLAQQPASRRAGRKRRRIRDAWEDLQGPHRRDARLADPGAARPRGLPRPVPVPSTARRTFSLRRSHPGQSRFLYCDPP